MKLRIRYFTTIRDLVGVREETVTLPEGFCVKDLKQRLVKNHPELSMALDSAIFAVNREFAFDDNPLIEGDEVAIFPPVSGGSVDHPTILRSTREALEMNALLEDIITPTAAAACVMTGVVKKHIERDESRETANRSRKAGNLMAEEQMEQLAREIREHWSTVDGLAIVQRIGDVQPGTPTIMVVCTAAYRDAEVLEAARYGLSRMKQMVHVLEKESDPEGELCSEGSCHRQEED